MQDRLRGWQRRLRALLHRRTADHELSAELAFHVDMETEHNIRTGMDPASARRAARLAFGGVDRFTEDVRDVRNISIVEDLAQDLRHAARGFARTPGFTIAASAALALGIGANTAVFSVVYGVVLAPLPFAEPDRLVQVWESHAAQTDGQTVSPGTMLDLRERSRTLSGIALVGTQNTLLSHGEQTWEAPTAAVSPELFDVLGIRPIVGRTFSARDRAGQPEEPGEEAVISHDLWQVRFGGDPDIAGLTLRMNERWSYTIVGVMPAGSEFPSGVQVLTPLTYRAPVPLQERQYRYYGAVARLAPGATLEQARADVAAIAAQLEREYSASNAGWTVRLAPLDRSILGDTRPALLVVFGLAGCVLLIACANVATLAVARATARRHEIAVRVALGAGRRRLVRQWMTEGLLLAALGGTLGLLVAWWSSSGLLALAPAGIPRIDEVGFGAPVVIFAAVVTVVAGVIIGLAPVRGARDGALLDAIRSRASAGVPGIRAREGLVGAQVALTFVLVVAAALLVRSFDRLRSADLGYRRHDVLSVELRVPSTRFPYPPWYHRLQYYDALMRELEAIPGVRSVAGTSNVPLTGAIGVGSLWRTDAPGATGAAPPTSSADQWRAVIQIVTPGYFTTMGIPVVRGRGFTTADRFSEYDFQFQDDPAPEGVAIINEAMRRRFWPVGDPVGEAIRLFDDLSFASHRTIVGVVADARVEAMDAPPSPAVFLPVAQHPGRALSLVIRSELPPRSLVESVTGRLEAYDPAVVIAAVRPLDEVVGGALSRPRFTMLLVGSFALLALAIAGVGVFGIVGYLVARRTQEIGIRIAIGARPVSVLWLVLREGLRPVLIGVVAGALAAVAVATAMRALLYDMAPLDAPSFAGAAVLLLAAAGLAAAVPARRAAGVDPLRSLRAE